MRPLVIISLLSLIGVIKCRPQQTLGQDISVQTQIRYQNQKSPQITSNIFNYKYTTLSNTAHRTVRKSSFPNSREIVYPKTTNNLKETKFLFTNNSKIVPDGRRNTETSSSRSPDQSFPKNIPLRQQSRTSFSNWREHTLIPYVEVPSSFPTFTNGNPRRSILISSPIHDNDSNPINTPITLDRNSFSSKENTHSSLESVFTNEFSSTIYGKDHPNTPRILPRSSSEKSIWRRSNNTRIVHFQNNIPKLSFNSSTTKGFRGEGSERTFREKGQGELFPIVKDGLIKNSMESIANPRFLDLQSESSNWFNNLTSFFKSRMGQVSQNGTHFESSRFLSGIGSQNKASGSEELQRSEDSKKRLRWHIFKSLFQRKLDPNKVIIANGAFPINITGSLNSTQKVSNMEEDLRKSNKNSRKAANKLQRPPGEGDVLNFKFNITKVSENEYKVSSKNKPKNITRVSFKNSTRNNIYKPKPLVRPYFTEETKKPFQDSQNKWFQLKLKNPHSQEGTEKHYDYSTFPSIYVANTLSQNPENINGVSISSHVPLERPDYSPYYPLTSNINPSHIIYGNQGVVYNNNPTSPEVNEYNSVHGGTAENFEDFQEDVPIISNTISTQNINGLNNLVISSSLTTPSPGGFNSNGPTIGNTITLSPEVVSISQGTHTLAGPDIPCTNLHIQSNVYNKEACQDLEITINNHVHTENNYYDDDDETGYQEGQDEQDYDEEEYEDDSNEATESAIISEDEYADELAQEAVVQEPVVAEALPVEPSVVENPVQSAASTGSNSGSNGILPNRPNFPRPGRPGGSSEEDDDGGLFGSGGLFSWFTSFNIFNFPFFGLLAAPLTIMLTSALGISTLFLPWTVLPTLFLGRKAKQRSSFGPFSRPLNSRPDGWFWHNKYKTWVNLTPQTNRASDDWGTVILDLIEDFGRRYIESYNQSWKRRKKDDTSLK